MKKHKQELGYDNILNSNPSHTQQKYGCLVCKYSTARKENYVRHMQSQKHIENNMIHHNHNQLVTINVDIYECKDCKKKYKSRSGLYKHTKQCKERLLLDAEQTNTKLTSIVMDLVKSNETLMELVKEPRIQINNTVNIEKYLNIECKDALNIADFVKQMQITLQDLLYLGDHGFSKSVQQLMLSSLKDMDQKMRPIHCTNKKKKTLYIKDEDVWSMDEEHKKLEKTINDIRKKEMKHAIEIIDTHQDFFREQDNLVKQNNIIIGLTNYDKDMMTKNVSKVLSKELYLKPDTQSILKK